MRTLCQVRCDLVIPRDLLTHPGVSAALHTLTTRSFREEIAPCPDTTPHIPAASSLTCPSPPERHPMRFLALVLTATVTFAAEAPAFTVAAAASLTKANDAALAAFVAKGGTKGVGNYAAASALAKQIENGAPADLFISADLRWMDYLSEKKLIDAGSRVNLVSNSLVLIAPKERSFTITLAKGVELGKAFAGRWATGDPTHVPVGAYAQEALTILGAWDALKPRLVATADVRAALKIVELGEVNAGIVYATDAKSAKGVVTVATFPADSHKPILYPAAIVGKGNDAARAYLAFLVSAEGQAVLAKFGFQPAK